MPVDSRKKIAVFSSGEGSTLTKIHEACQRGNLPAEILLIISNKAHSGAIERAKRHAIDSYLFDTGNNEDTIKTESDLVGLLKQSKIDWILLLGYTRKIGPKLLTAFNNRIINTHPSLLPKYGGKGFYGRKIHEAVLASGDILTGATVHLVNEEYDSGEILSQIAVPVLPKDSATTLEARVKKTEKAHLIKVLNELWKNNN
ncbi:MAG: phosphoribosylglycinamide formyltransferase [Candidatus Azotimanducaceae bacterium]